MVMQFTLELIKMMIHPIRNSRGVVEMINDFQEQLQAQMMAPPPPMMGLRPAASREPRPVGSRWARQDRHPHLLGSHREPVPVHHPS